MRIDGAPKAALPAPAALPLATPAPAPNIDVPSKGLATVTDKSQLELPPLPEPRRQRIYKPRDNVIIGPAMPKTLPVETTGLLRVLEAIVHFFTAGLVCPSYDEELEALGRDFASKNRGMFEAATMIGARLDQGVVVLDRLASVVQAELLSADAAAHRPPNVASAKVRAAQVTRAAAQQFMADQGAAMDHAETLTGLSVKSFPSPDGFEQKGKNAVEQLAVKIPGARQLADALGSPWPALVQQALVPPERNDRAVSTRLEEEPTLARNGRLHPYLVAPILQARIDVLCFLMAAKSSNAFANIPASLGAELASAANHDQATFSEVAGIMTVANLPDEQRQAVFAELSPLPSAKKGHALGVIAEERMALASSDSVERGAAVARIALAVRQLDAFSEGEIAHAILNESLGLEPPESLVVNFAEGKSLSVPVYFHPGVPSAQRAEVLEIIAKGFQSYPFLLAQKLAQGEGGRPLTIQALPPQADLSPGRGGQYTPRTNVLQLNFDWIREPAGGPNEDEQMQPGEIVAHELAHAVDDILLPDQEAGATDVARSPFRAHYEEITKRLAAAAAAHNGAIDPSEIRRLVNEVGAVSLYAINKSPHEYFAECLAYYVDPKYREQLRAVDPVMCKVVERFLALCEVGDFDHAREIVLLGPDPATAAAQTLPKLDHALDTATLDRLDHVAEVYALAADAFKDWKAPDRKDALTPAARLSPLADFRRKERRTMLAQGWKLLQKIQKRLDIEPPGGARQRLQNIATRLSTTIESTM